MFEWRKIGASFRTRLLPILLLLAVLFPASALPAKELDKYQFQSLFIYNFIKAFEWPEIIYTEDGIKNIELCILGDDPLKKHIDNIAKLALKVSTDNSKNVKINITRNAQKANLAACNVAYISSSEGKRYKTYLSSLKQYPILTISELSDFAEDGGIVQIKTRRNRQVFVINKGVANNVGLKIDADTLSNALEVIN